MEMSSNGSEIEQLEQELKRARELVFQTAKLAEMGKLVAVVVHELSQPLLGIKAFAQILRRRYRDDEFIEPKVKMIEEQAIHMETILDSLRRYSKLPESGQAEVDPLEPVRSAMELFQERAKKLRIQMQVKIPESLPMVCGNHGHVQQVVVNLLSNSLDELEATKGGLILVRLEEVEGAVRLRVADTGKGVEEHARERIFEHFYTDKSGEKGTGLGLAICKDILEHIHGEIRLMEPGEVESVFGAGFGAAFEVLLKQAPEQE
jgi:signal transduction histidine kinase